MTRTKLLPDPRRPDDGVELDLGDPKGTFTYQLDRLVLEGVVPVSQQDTLKLWHISIRSALLSIRRSLAPFSAALWRDEL